MAIAGGHNCSFVFSSRVGSIFRRFGYALAAFVLAVLVLSMAGCIGGKSSNQTQDDVLTITLWHPWGGSSKEKLASVVREFNRTHSEFHVRASFCPTDLDSSQKFFTSVAANKPPDVTFVAGDQTAAYAEQGALQPLDSFIKEAGIRPEDFFTPCWLQSYYKNHVWSMAYCADPNFAFAWNKKVFRDCGLDPEKPPRTIAEVDKYNDIISRVDGDKITRIGIIPWQQFSSANATFTWGWAFGGSFFDPKSNKITCNEPKVLKAVEWMVSYGKKYDITKVNAFASGFGSRDQNPFYTGQIGMTCLFISQLEDIKEYAPNLDYGLTFIPAPPDGEQNSSWVGGWCLAIPKGSKHPKEAWEFIRWCCRDPKGTTVVCRIQGLLPGYRKSPYLDEVRHKPGYDQFVRILELSKHQRPRMPAQSFYMGALNRAIDYSLYGTLTCKQAMDNAAKDTQRELNLRLAGGR